MEKQTEKIKKFSKVVYILLQIAFVVFIVVASLELVTWIMKTAGVQPIVKFGNTEIYLYPIIEFDKSNIGSSLLNDFVPMLGTFSLEKILSTIFIAVALGITKRVFKLLKIEGSPFREEIIKQLKKSAVALLIVGVFTGIIGFIAAGIVWVLYLIFDYGCALQKESDTTL